MDVLQEKGGVTPNGAKKAVRHGGNKPKVGHYVEFLVGACYHCLMLPPLKVWNLTLNMLSSKYLRCKAAETHGLLLFVVEMLQKHKNHLAGDLQFDLLRSAGHAALDFDAVLNGHDRIFPRESCQSLLNHCNRFILLCERAAIPLLPKAHMMYHCIQRSLEKGNPRMYSTYIDESYNGAIARVCRSVHRRNWAMAVYRKLEMLEHVEQEPLSAN